MFIPMLQKLSRLTIIRTEMAKAKAKANPSRTTPTRSTTAVSRLEILRNPSKSFSIPVLPICGYPKWDACIAEILSLARNTSTIIRPAIPIRKMAASLKSCTAVAASMDTLVPTTLHSQMI
eukprot:Lithocolla_globosa_v1_NODE_4958_length_1329_cov_4.645212.p3 type:complete len:121 gc:universal NODE_4958_length_1329_cov_4.645212:1204-842(-)